ncbi:MAG: autotransporter domain-containing protein, partial [Opitutales bacterium]|nr:autotransporter domain-containing protein [Opitutales bacterium]
KTSVTVGTFAVSDTATLGNGSFDVAGTLALNGNRTFSNTTSGNGKIEISSGSTTFTNDVGVKTLSISQGTSATLNAGVDLMHANAEAQVAGTLNLLGTRTVSAKTSGNGELLLASGSDVSFAKSVGVKKLSVESGATLRGSVSMTHGAAAELSLAGTLVLNVDKGEKVSLGGGKVTLASSAKLDVVGGSFPARASATQIAALERGSKIVLFENGTVSGDVVSFLRTDADLTAYAQNYTVVYDTANGGLSVQVVKNAATLADGLDTSELSESFVDWALSDANAALSNLSRGFVNAANLGNLSGGNDPLLKAILGGNASEARAILDRLSPKSYAAMVAMPVEAFNSDARSISARLEQRRYDRFSKNAQWEFFAQLQTASVENDTAPDAPTFDFDTTGLLAGADYKLDKNTMLGIALGASTGEAKVHNSGGKIESTDFRVTGFAGKTIGNYFVNAGAQVGYASYDIKRNTDYGNASADTTGWSAGLFADAGTVITLSEAKKIYATPYVGLAYMHTQADAFTESGSDKAFDADTISGDSLRARLGCGFSWGFAASGAVWRLGLDVAFSHDFLGDEVDIDVTAQDGSSITETAKALPEDMFSIGPSFNVDVSSSSSIYGGYSFNAGTDSSVNHSANVGFRMRF